MIIRKCYRYRLNPSPEQEQKFFQWSGCRRFVWNWALARRQAHYKATGKGISYNDLASELVSLKKELLWLKEADSQCLQQVLRDLDVSYTNFFQKRARFPKRKKKFKTPNAFRIPQRVSVKEDQCLLPKIGLVPMVYHRDTEGEVKSTTIKQEPSGRWYATFVTQQDIPDVEPMSIQNPIGIDVGLGTFLTLSDGTQVGSPKFFRNAQKKIKLASRRLNRKKTGSSNRHKAKKKRALLYARSRQKRNDFLHKISSDLVNHHDLICMEDLNIKALAKTKLRGHSKSWSDAAHGALRQMLQYKTAWNNKKLICIGRYFASSQVCSCCGHKQKLELSDRVWQCGHCQTKHDRDHNASVNILREGMRLLACG